jgi:hypothetical protein
MLLTSTYVIQQYQQIIVAIPLQQFQHFIFFTVTYLSQQYRIHSFLGFRDNNGYAKTPDLFRSTVIPYPLSHRFRLSAKWLDVLFPPAALRPHSESWPPLTGLRDHTLWTRPAR